MAADASNAGLGYVLEIQGQPTVKGQIQQAGGEDHINRRELLAFQRAVEENAEALEGGKMVWYVGNSMVAIIRKQETQHIAAEMWEVGKKMLDLLESKSMGVIVKKVPGALNGAADRLSSPGVAEAGWEGAISTITEKWAHWRRMLQACSKLQKD